MEVSQTLIDKAIERCSSAYRLSQLTGISQGNISEMRKGNRPMPPSTAAQLAEIAGVDPREAALEAVVAKEKDEAKISQLRALLGLPQTPVCVLC